MIAIAGLMCLLCMIGLSNGEYKRWAADTNFGNPANWNAKRPPCGNDVVIIPNESPVLYMQLNTTIKELVLPKNGELILDKNSVLGFTDQATDGCPDFGGDVEFTAVNPVPWLDPSSWCSTSSERGQCDVTTMRLDVEKVPCTFDDVVFPRDHLYFVDLSDAPSSLSMKSLKLSGTSLSSTSFTDLLNTDDGQRLFRTVSGSSNAGIDVTRKSCDDVSGCACGNDRPEISKRICKHVSKRCKRPRCKTTIQPVGSCCRMCGAVFNITRGYGFNLADFQNTIKSKFFPKPQSDVNMTNSVTSEGWLQMVLTDMTGENSARLGYEIKADFDADLAAGGHRYAIDGVQFSLASGPPIGPQTSASTGTQMSGGSIAGIFFGVLIALFFIIVIAVIFVYRRQGKPLPIPDVHLPPMPKLPPMPRLPAMPSLPRMLRRQGRYSERGPEQPQTLPHVDPGFANPLYDSSPFDDGNSMVREMELIEASQDVQPTFDVSEGGFNNPLYASKRGMSFKDPSKVEPATAEEGVRASDPEASSTSTTPAATSAILIDTDGAESNPDSTI